MRRPIGFVVTAGRAALDNDTEAKVVWIQRAG
jgi:hypothetical protein